MEITEVRPAFYAVLDLVSKMFVSRTGMFTLWNKFDHAVEFNTYADAKRVVDTFEDVRTTALIPVAVMVFEVAPGRFTWSRIPTIGILD